MSVYNNSKEWEAVRKHLLVQMQAHVSPDQWLEAEAETINMSNVQLGGFVRLMASGEHLFNASNLMRRVPDVQVLECVQRVLPQLCR